MTRAFALLLPLALLTVGPSRATAQQPETAGQQPVQQPETAVPQPPPEQQQPQIEQEQPPQTESTAHTSAKENPKAKQEQGSAKKSTAKKKATSEAKSPKKKLGTDVRLNYIRRAQVWKATDIPSMDLRSGPQGAGAFKPDEMV